MENQLQLIGKRIQETRQVLEISVEEMAQVTGVTREEYLAHERGELDHSFTFIYHCAERFGIDISNLVKGVTPKLSFYDLTRKDEGMRIKRRQDFEYQHLAPNLKKRYNEPFMVTAPPPKDPASPIPLSTHAGQEFDYILSGELKIQLGDKVEIMRPGDSILYDSGHPHGMVAVGNTPCVFLAIVYKWKKGLEKPSSSPQGMQTSSATSLRKRPWTRMAISRISNSNIRKTSTLPMMFWMLLPPKSPMPLPSSIWTGTM